MIKKWQLLAKKDVSPSSWFPIESRTYQLPNGKVIDDFTVSTIPNVSMVIAITKDQKVVLVHQYKPGVNEIMYQFPAGRLEEKHRDLLELAQHELEEEAGIKVEKEKLEYLGRFTGFSTKSSEVVSMYLATDCEFNSKQNLDVTEDIEVVTVSFDHLEEMIKNNQIICAQTVAGWQLAKLKMKN
jgi:8-oxo-dGTP pyrophosphatase MutT (NUDIX family)